MAVTRTCACGQRNRIGAENLHRTGRCGACKATLRPWAEPIEIADEASFDDIVARASVPILVDFWATWCGPCRAAAPEVERAAHELAGRGLVLKVDTDAQPRLAARYGVRGIPHFAVLYRGSVVTAASGLVGSRELVSRVLRARGDSAA